MTNRKKPYTHIAWPRNKIKSNAKNHDKSVEEFGRKQTDENRKLDGKLV